MSNERKIDSSLRVKRFEATEKAKKAVSLETMIRDLEDIAVALSHQIEAEEERTKVSDARCANYSLVALSAATRRRKLMVSLVDLTAALQAAKREHAAAANEARNSRIGTRAPRRASTWHKTSWSTWTWNGRSLGLSARVLALIPAGRQHRLRSPDIFGGQPPLNDPYRSGFSDAKSRCCANGLGEVNKK